MPVLYHYLKLTLPLFYRVFFRRIYLNGFDQLPKGKPIILASNHPNSFLDGVNISFFITRKVMIMVRGDVFKKKLVDKALRSMLLRPVFRKEDGDGLRNSAQANEESFNQSYRDLLKNQIVLIFSEAVSRSEYRLRPLKKGTARMAFEIWEKSDRKMDLYVVPMGVNYTYFKGYGKDFFMTIGKAIPVSQYAEAFDANPPRAMVQMTNDIQVGIKKKVWHVNDREKQEAALQWLNIARSDLKLPFFGGIFRDKPRFHSEKANLEAFNNLNEEDRNTVADKLKHYFESLKSAKTTDRVVSGNPGSGVLRYLVLLLFFVPALVGYVFHGWVRIIGKRIADNTVKKPEFYDSVLMGSTLMISHIWIVVLAIVFGLIWGWKGVLLAWVTRWCAQAVQHWYHAFIELTARMTWRNITTKDQDQLREMRKEIVAMVKG